jgi:hypothetical protein
MFSTMDTGAASCKSMTRALHHVMSELNVILYVAVSMLVPWFALWKGGLRRLAHLGLVRWPSYVPVPGVRRHHV